MSDLFDWDAPFNAPPPMVSTPDDFKRQWHCKVEGVRRIHCKPYRPHVGTGCAWKYCLEMTEEAYTAWKQEYDGKVRPDPE